MKTVGYMLINVLKYGLKCTGIILRIILIFFLAVMRMALSVMKLAEQ